jgi:hypothetical protein
LFIRLNGNHRKPKIFTVPTMGLFARLFNNGVICLLEAPPIRMVAKDGRSGIEGKPTSLWVFHEAFHEVDRQPPVHRPTYFRIRQTPLIADRGFGHDPTHRSFRRETVVPSSNNNVSPIPEFASNTADDISV